MKNQTRDMNSAWQMCLVVLFTALVVLTPDMAFASGINSTLGAGLCIVAQAFYGQVASAIATIAICVIGAMACLGRVQWTSALVVGAGIATLFGASALVAQVSIGQGC
jgi:type IV secretory pathway VirB2 component (pilin)